MQVLLEQAADNIRAAAAALVAGQKETTETLVASIKAEQQDVLTRAEQLLQLDGMPTDASSKLGALPVTEPGAPVSLDDCCDMVDSHPDLAISAKSHWELTGKLAACMLPQVSLIWHAVCSTIH